MHSLTYVSSADSDLSSDQLAHLLTLWRPRNQAAEITGMLLFSGGNIIQVLEGAESSVREVYADIASDPRHHDVTILLDEPTEQREFTRWSMGFSDVGDLDVSSLEGYDDFMRTGLGRELDAHTAPAFHLLETFRSTMR